MTMERLFGNDIKPACKYCAEAFQAMGEDQFLCLKRGVVPPDYSCRKFEYDPLRRVPPRPAPILRYTEEEFSLD